jgi:phenylacetate-CoA ligase
VGNFRRPFEVVDYEALMRAHAPPPEYFEGDYLALPEVIEKRQLERLKDRARRTYEVPFFRDRFDRAGVSPADLQSLDDLSRFPAYRVDDIRKSIEANPPLGDYQGASLEGVLENPVRVFMSGATTGAPRPTLYTQWDREAGAILMARALYLQGVRPGDVVLNAWAYSTHNGAFAFDEALHKWLNCVVLTTGTGNVTSSRRQIELAHQYQATAILTTGDYLLHLADVAREMGLDPKRDFNLKALPNIGDRAALEEVWGVPNYQSYGFHEVQWVSVECPERQGLHIFEDAFVVQILDVDTGEVLPDGEQGAVCITELYKTGSPQFRYNIMDLSTLYPREQCSCGSWLRKMAPFAGRGDNMVKLRGVNVWPEALGEIATAVTDVGDDYFVRAYRESDRDEIVVSVTSDADPTRFAELADDVGTALRDATGVRIKAQVLAPRSLDEQTGFGSAAKLIRFCDDRP